MSLRTVQRLKFKRLTLPRTSQNKAAIEFSYTTWGNGTVNGTVSSKNIFAVFIKKLNVYIHRVKYTEAFKIQKFIQEE